jgi:Lar family restriction alleviation protein
MEALKPCPFCGEKSDLSIRSLCGVVVCTVCSAEGPCRGTKKEIIAAWNTRIDPQREQLVKALKALVALDDGNEPFAWEYAEEFNAARAALTAAGEQL